jgi:hypothetical protein
LSGPQLPRWLGGDAPSRDQSSEPLVGWRAWQILEDAEGPVLRSWAHDTRWPARRALESRCFVHGAKPAFHHSCGIHAFADRDAALDYVAQRPEGPRLFVRHPDNALGIAFGRVSGWGRAVRHDRGWRSQYAYPFDLCLLAGDRRLALALADRYAVETSPLPPTR